MTKIITVPKDRNAMDALDFDQANENQLLELRISKEDFDDIWKVGLFQEINQIINSNIDIAEDESINDIESLQKLLDSNIFSRADYTPRQTEIINHLKNLIIAAVDRNTGIFFYF
ncbi:hypothetical protein [Edaphocola flava]|uniref:hypothetical protein n=1 Tax=Edaphocola flava TaxID=2499629 RepID=UPI00100B5CE6|nr:hypothetical protein [Edaphocola flava]